MLLGKFGNMEFYKGKKVLVTGHTGFKGTWLCQMLVCFGADVVGYSLEPNTTPSIYNLSGIEAKIKSYIADIRDYESLKYGYEIVFHLAAQPIVRESYNKPRYTYETNVMGTVNVCECIRNSSNVKSFLNVTTDKVYENNEADIAFTEDMPLDGFDPYSNSKSCSELVTHSYKNSFFDNMDVAISTARAGNVIGGGDFANDRLIPDCVRAIESGKEIKVRNPYSTRPFQHVLEPLYVYLLIAKKQYEDKRYQGYYNVGPNDSDCISVGELVDLFCSVWCDGAKWKNVCEENAPHEASFLKLDTTKVKTTFGWSPVWNINYTVEKIVEWTRCYLNGQNISELMDRQIKEFLDAVK